MPSRRDLIRMTSDEERAYLRAQRRVILVTIGADGMPHAVPMNYGLDEEGRVLITSFRKSQKVRNLERDPRATLLVESGETYAQLKSVMAYCRVDIVTAPDAIAKGMARINADTKLSDSISGAMTDQVRASLAKRVLLRFTPWRTVNWDHAKLGSFY